MADVQWGLAQGPNAFEGAFSQGLQLGDALRKRREEQQTKNALSGYLGSMGQPGVVATPEQQAASQAAEAQLLKVNPELYLKAQNFRAQEQKSVADRTAAQQKAAREAIPQQLSMLRSATPENWSQIRAQAIQLGVGSEKGLPTEWNPDFVSAQSKILSAFQEQPDLMTNEVKTILASLPPEQRDLSNPAAYNAVARAAEKLVPLQPGGSAIGYNPATGQSRTVVAQNPGGFAAGAPAQPGAPAISNTPAPQLGANGNPIALDERQYAATVASMGAERTDAWMAKNNIPLAKTINGATAYRIGGKWYDNPEGR